MLGRAAQRAQRSACASSLRCGAAQASGRPFSASTSPAAAVSASAPPSAPAAETAALLSDLDELLRAYPLLEHAWPQRIQQARDRLKDPSRAAVIAGA